MTHFKVRFTYYLSPLPMLCYCKLLVNLDDLTLSRQELPQLSWRLNKTDADQVISHFPYFYTLP